MENPSLGRKWNRNRPRGEPLILPGGEAGATKGSFDEMPPTANGPEIRLAFRKVGGIFARS